MREEYDITKVDLTIPEFTKMSDLERIYLIELLLKDIRSNWDTDPIHRAKLAASLCIELTVNNPLAYKDFSTLYDVITDYIDMINNKEDIDGRYFREDFPNGYIDMSGFYDGKLSYNYQDKSDDFKKLVDNFITCPRFNDN